MKLNDKKEEHEDNLALILNDAEYLLVDYKLIKQNNSLSVRVTIEKKEGITHKDCQRVTKLLQTFLEDHSLPSDCKIEVSSPGLNRVLKTKRELEIFQGRKVSVSYKDNAKFLQETGLLKEAGSDQILITIDDKDKYFPFEWIQKIRLVE